jgi:hypothetical protein
MSLAWFGGKALCWQQKHVLAWLVADSMARCTGLSTMHQSAKAMMCQLHLKHIMFRAADSSGTFVQQQ